MCGEDEETEDKVPPPWPAKAEFCWTTTRGTILPEGEGATLSEAEDEGGRVEVKNEGQDEEDEDEELEEDKEEEDGKDGDNDRESLPRNTAEEKALRTTKTGGIKRPEDEEEDENDDEEEDEDEEEEEDTKFGCE